MSENWPGNFVDADDFNTHNANTTTPHGATADRTASKIVIRDASGNLPGNGVAFPASQSASADANTLDDYEEGTATLTLTCGTSGTITLSSTYNKGFYTKIGREVFIEGYLSVESVNSPVGSLTLGGLPFTATGNLGIAGAVTICVHTALETTAITVIQGYVNGGTATAILSHYAAGVPNDLAADIKASSGLAISMHYTV